MKTVRPKVRCRVRTSSSKSPAPIGSRPEVGSSRDTSCGSSASARGTRAPLIHPPRKLAGETVGDLRLEAAHAEFCHHDLVHQPLRDLQVLAHRELDVLPHR